MTPLPELAKYKKCHDFRALIPRSYHHALASRSVKAAPDKPGDDEVPARALHNQASVGFNLLFSMKR
jgi:hypothetical protein